MTKKKETKVEVEEPQIKEKIVETPKVEVKPKKVEKPLPTPKGAWEFKTRTYFLRNNMSPLSYSIKSSGIHWFDEEKGYERELKYTSNQRTCFVDEMKGDQRLEHIIFRNGILTVPKEKTVLQKLLSLYHPHKDKLFYEWKPIKRAEQEIDVLELEVEALIAAKELDIDVAEAVMRVEIGSEVSKMSSKELKRDLLLFAKKKPKLLLDLVRDENVMLRNFGIRATEAGILKLSGDQRYFTWRSNGKKLMTVPFQEHPYSALAQWFKTDEGMEIYSNIEKQLK
jgi:hypothetical protein